MDAGNKAYLIWEDSRGAMYSYSLCYLYSSPCPQWRSLSFEAPPPDQWIDGLRYPSCYYNHYYSFSHPHQLFFNSVKKYNPPPHVQCLLYKIQNTKRQCLPYKIQKDRSRDLLPLNPSCSICFSVSHLYPSTFITHWTELSCCQLKYLFICVSWASVHFRHLLNWIFSLST